MARVRTLRLGVVIAGSVAPGCAPPMECGGALDLTAPDAEFLYAGDVLPTFTLDLSPSARAALPVTAQEDDDVEVPARFGYGSESWEAGLRLKGHASFRPIDAKPALKVDLHAYDDTATFHGVRRFVFNNMVGDPSMVVEELVADLYAALGLPSARHGYACLTVDGEDYGLYGVVEAMDEQFLARAFADPSGYLYEGSFGADLRPSAVGGFEVQEPGDGVAHADLEALAAELEATADGGVLAFIDAHFDRDALLGAWAAELVVGNIDGYLARGNNYLLYHEPAAERWWMLPWGVDESLRTDVDVRAPEWTDDAHDAQGLLYVRCAAEPACEDALEARVLEVADRVEADDLAADARALVGRMRRVSRADPMSGPSAWQVAWAQQDVVAFVRARPDVVRDQLALPE